MVNEQDLRGLSPEERIRKLKKLEQDRKAEIMQAEKLIKQSEDQIVHEREVTRKIPLPQMRSIDPSTLFSRDEKRLFEAHRQTSVKEDEHTSAASPRKKNEESLEEAVAGAPRNPQEPLGVRYGKQLEETLGMAYKTLTEFQNQISEKGYLTKDQQEAVEIYKHKIEDIQHSMHDGSNPNRDAMGLVYGGLERVADLEKQMGYAKKQFAGGQSPPKYRF